MSVITNNLLLGDEGYFLTKSLRFRSSASAYLNRTATNPTNAQKGTFSAWIKRGKFTQSTDPNNGDLVGSGESGGYAMIQYYGQNLYFGERGSNGYISTAAVFRDPSAWYHVFCVFDTTLATANDRLQIWVNGVRQTAGTFNVAPTQNSSFKFLNENGQLYNIGAEQSSTSARHFFDGYMAEVYFIDGQALTPSSFGETSTSTGVWIPKKYTGTYGTNGFYLDFEDTSSVAALGYDAAGSNDWTVNNISLTSGSTYDSMKDVPTLTDTDTANYAVLNPLQFAGTNGNLPSDGNLTVNSNGSSNPTKAFPSTIAASSGKFYAEFTISQTQYIQVAVADVGTWTSTYGSGLLYGSGTVSWDLSQLKYYINSTSSTATGITGASNDVMQIAFDADTRKVWFGRNGTWNASGDPSAGTGEIGTVAGTGALVFVVRSENMTTYCNFGQRPFAYTPPTGFKALNTFNLPTPTIGATASSQANDYFDATLYTGNGSTQSITNSGSMQPDFVWIKQRNGTRKHNLYDVIRGVGKELYSHLTDAETNAPDSLTTFNSNGFSLGNDGGSNVSSGSFVAWQWKANGSGSTNTAGSITSTVSANTTAGFSIVTWSGNSTIGATVGHGLGVAPSMIIVKQRTGVESWATYHTSLGATKYLDLNSTAAAATSISRWNNTAPSSSVITLYNDSVNNGSGSTYVAYCFAQIAGYSAFGSYTGNGSSDGPFVFTNFQPAFVMVKRTDTTGNWFIVDNKRLGYNGGTKNLYPNLSNAEATLELDLISNGFKWRLSGADVNASGGSYIYMAVASNPFKYSLGA